MQNRVSDKVVGILGAIDTRRAAFDLLAIQVVDAFCKEKVITSGLVIMSREELKGMIAGALHGYDSLIAKKITEMVAVAGTPIPTIEIDLSND